MNERDRSRRNQADDEPPFLTIASNAASDAVGLYFEPFFRLVKWLRLLLIVSLSASMVYIVWAASHLLSDMARGAGAFLVGSVLCGNSAWKLFRVKSIPFEHPPWYPAAMVAGAMAGLAFISYGVYIGESPLVAVIAAIIGGGSGVLAALDKISGRRDS